MRMKRREFLGAAVAGTASALVGGDPAVAVAQQAAPVEVNPTAVVQLGKELRACRLGSGTGMRGGGRQTNQTRMGREKFEALLNHSYDQGIRLFDAADLYGTHPYIGRVMQDKPRDNFQIVSKIWVRRGGILEPERPLADVLVERFLRELRMDYIDVLQIHCMTSPDWPDEQRPQMDAMEKLKERGLIRAHGVSCHSLAALRTAAEEAWVDVIHARVNPYGAKMDDRPENVVPVLEKARANGKGVIGMKLAGEGTFDAEQRKRTVEWALNLGCLDVLIVGFEKPEEIDEFKANVRETLVAQARQLGATKT